VSKLFYRLVFVLCGVTLALVAATRFASGGQGDAARGAAIYDGNMAVCSVCHERGVLAPSLAGIEEQISSVRLNMMGHRDKTPEQYLAESILYPSNYIVPAYTGTMPEIYARILSLEDVQDLVAYLLTL
jgi:hypothetical protein